MVDVTTRDAVKAGLDAKASDAVRKGPVRDAALHKLVAEPANAVYSSC